MRRLKHGAFSHVPKTKELVICTKPDVTVEVSLGGRLVEPVETLKYLGTVLDVHGGFPF